ncbi:MAG TPA: FlgD immunoglobulin-like domain containing protein [Rhodothermales bacterium]|nr:FlgD immunoglobulin-like domain containing protein [Rhodothermales bacterium]
MIVCCLLTVLAGFPANSAQAQSKQVSVAEALALVPSPGILRNSISNLHAEGDSLWVGPFLNVTADGGTTWQVADADSLAGFRNRAYSIDVEGSVIWAGLAISQNREIDGQTQSVDVARGFLFSEDGGTTWTYRSPLAPSDNDPNTTGILDLPEDTLTTYGNVQLSTLAITVPETSPPWDIDYDPATGTLWSVNQVAGLRKSTDKARTWQRVVLPPDTTQFLSPDLGYDFPFFVQPSGIPIDQFAGLNFQTFAVLVDGAGRVWSGAVGGLNVSEDQGESWRHFTTEQGLTGNWVISIEEQEIPGQEPAIWATNWPALEQGEQFGVVVTRNGGETFEASLLGERVYDFAFRGETVYAAGENGLFISDDGGVSWRTVRDFYDPTQPDRTFRPGARIFAVATTREALWVGTEDGLFRSTDGGATWRVFRAEVPLSPDNLPPVVPADAVPEVEAYAYPNPFSPASDRFIRIRYKLEQPETVDIRIFDFGMNLVRDVTSESQNEGEREISWDGTDNNGARVANGTYFYAVETGSETFWGKILVLE